MNANLAFRLDPSARLKELEVTRSSKVAITRVTLRPEVVFSGEQRPTRADLDRLHHKAHEECYIANSVKSELLCEPVWRD